MLSQKYLPVLRRRGQSDVGLHQRNRALVKWGFVCVLHFIAASPRHSALITLYTVTTNHPVSCCKQDHSTKIVSLKYNIQIFRLIIIALARVQRKDFIFSTGQIRIIGARFKQERQSVYKLF